MTIDKAPEWKRDPDYPCDKYEAGQLGLGDFAECESDGHYLCKTCKWLVKKEVKP